MTLMPLARTPMDKKGADGIRDYTKSVSRMLDDMTPWKSKSLSRRANLRGKVKPGEVVVVLDGTDSQADPLYSGAKTTRE